MIADDGRAIALFMRHFGLFAARLRMVKRSAFRRLLPKLILSLRLGQPLGRFAQATSSLPSGKLFRGVSRRARRQGGHQRQPPLLRPARYLPGQATVGLHGDGSAPSHLSTQTSSLFIDD
jgi:hypothetical protein